jgi:hypothetical protein
MRFITLGFAALCTTTSAFLQAENETVVAADSKPKSVGSTDKNTFTIKPVMDITGTTQEGFSMDFTIGGEDVNDISISFDDVGLSIPAMADKKGYDPTKSKNKPKGTDHTDYITYKDDVCAGGKMCLKSFPFNQYKKANDADHQIGFPMKTANADTDFLTQAIAGKEIKQRTVSFWKHSKDYKMQIGGADSGLLKDKKMEYAKLANAAGWAMAVTDSKFGATTLKTKVDSVEFTMQTTNEVPVAFITELCAELAKKDKDFTKLGASCANSKKKTCDKMDDIVFDVTNNDA